MVWGRSRKTVTLLPLKMGFERVTCQKKGDISLHPMIENIIRMILIWARYELKTDFFTFIFLTMISNLLS